MKNEPIYYNRISLTNTVSSKKGGCFAFGIILSDKPRNAFFPHWITERFDITDEDVGVELHCFYVDREEDKHPCVIAITEEDPTPMLEVGSFSGKPGTDSFSAEISQINRGRDSRLED